MAATSYYLNRIVLLVLCSCLPALGFSDAYESYRLSVQPSELLDAEAVEAYAKFLDFDRTVNVRVYGPKMDDASSPPGVILYFSPVSDASIPNHWKDLFERKKLMWICVEDNGNKVASRKRMLRGFIGLLAASQQKYLDSSRLYVAGFSGGGRMASTMLPLYSELLTGAIYIGGADYTRRAIRDNLDSLRQRRVVFINGEDDFNLRDSRYVHKKYLKEGLEKSLFIKVPDLGHAIPDASILEQAVVFLDGES